MIIHLVRAVDISLYKLMYCCCYLLLLIGLCFLSILLPPLTLVKTNLGGGDDFRDYISFVLAIFYFQFLPRVKSALRFSSRFLVIISIVIFSELKKIFKCFVAGLFFLSPFLCSDRTVVDHTTK